MTKKAKVGRRPRRGGRMPSTSFTALMEELTFLMILGDGNVSEGIQKAVQRLATGEPDTVAMMKKANWMVEEAGKELDKTNTGNKEKTQSEIYRYIADHYWELAEAYQPDYEAG